MPPTSAPQVDMPKTPQGAPPSFYNHMAGMQSGAGVGATQNQPAGQDQQKPVTPGGPDTQKFVEMTSKLLTVLDAMQAMKPNGIDVTKFTQAAADAMKQCLERVKSGDTTPAPGTQPNAGATGQMPGDQTAGNQGGGVAVPPQTAQ